MVYIAGFRHTDNRMNHQVCLRFFGCTKGEFLMCTVQRVPCLKRHHFAPPQFAEIGPQFVGRVTAGAEIVMDRLLYPHNRSAEVHRTCRVMQIIDCRMGKIICSKDQLCFFCFVWHPAICDGHGCEDHAFLVAQCNILTYVEFFCKGFAHIQSDGHGP